MKPLERLLFMQGGECFFCKKPLAQSDASVEHLLASSRGGGDHDENCVACCKSLNALLGSMSLKQKIQVVLNQRGQFACPNGVQRKVTKTDQATQKATKLATDRYAQVVANLKTRGNSKPRTIAALNSTIAALFKKKLRPDEVNALVQELQTRRVIVVAGTKVTYT